MKCPRCGAALKAGAVSFCPNCGKRIRPQTQKIPAPPKRRPSSDYDSYYRDTPTADGNHPRERFDPALAKRIALLALGVLMIITLAVLAMYFL